MRQFHHWLEYDAAELGKEMKEKWNEQSRVRAWCIYEEQLTTVDEQEQRRPLEQGSHWTERVGRTGQIKHYTNYTRIVLASSWNGLTTTQPEPLWRRETSLPLCKRGRLHASFLGSRARLSGLSHRSRPPSKPMMSNQAPIPALQT
jgi:hypothetical protein